VLGEQHVSRLTPPRPSGRPFAGSRAEALAEAGHPLRSESEARRCRTHVASRSATDIIVFLASANQDMNKRQRLRAELLKLKAVQRGGDSTAANNLAATYRQLGNRRRSFHWWKRAAKTRGGDNAWLEVGYCCQYGIGVRRDVNTAIRSYRKAIRKYYVSDYEREEARYHLAIALLDRDAGSSTRQKAEQLLREAAADGDYPQAADLLRQLSNDGRLQVCRCRRHLRASLGGRAHCELHSRKL
jgi:TPR repeat protein